jgi:putative SOS response-associated peptidase YedK
MCGRYFLTTPGDVLAAELELESVPELEPRYNIAPSQPVAVVRASEPGPGRALARVTWGLIPGWARERAIGNRLINARGETLAEKPSFRDAFRKRRCLIPADGFFEWQKLPGGKQPFVLRRKGGGPITFAGLWSSWKDRETGEALETCAIVTTTPNELAATVHDRMPVLLGRAARADWLDPAADPNALSALLVPYPAAEMEAYPVSRRVNDPGHDDPACIEPVPA